MNETKEEIANTRATSSLHDDIYAWYSNYYHRIPFCTAVSCKKGSKGTF